MRASVVLPVALLTLCAACGSGKPEKPEALTVRGTVTIYDNNVSPFSPDRVDPDNSGVCIGFGDAADVTPGAQVVVTNSYGRQVGITSLSEGTPDKGTASCSFKFKVRVPADSSYKVQVGDHPDYAFTRKQAGTLEVDFDA